MTSTATIDNEQSTTSAIVRISTHTGKPVATEQEKYNTYKRLSAMRVPHSAHYKHISEALNKWATSEAAEKRTEILARVHVSDIPTFDEFLKTLPETDRQLNNCNCCRAWYERNANVVVVSEDGSLRSLYWDVETAPAEFKQFVSDVKVAVEAGRISDLYEEGEAKQKPKSPVTVGGEVVGYFEHWHNSDLSVNARGLKPASRTSVVNIVSNLAGTMANDGAVQTAGADLKKRVLEIESEDSVVLSHIRLLTAYLELAKTIARARRGEISHEDSFNKCVFIVATNHTLEFFNASAIGGNFQKYVMGSIGLKDATSLYFSSIDKTKYMRKIADVSDGRIRETEKFLEEGGYGPSLKLKQMSHTDYLARKTGAGELLWQRKGSEEIKPVVESPKTGGLLSGLYKSAQDEKAAEKVDKPTLAVKPLTVARFISEVLPKALSLKVDLSKTAAAAHRDLMTRRANLMKIASRMNFVMESGLDGPAIWENDEKAIAKGYRMNTTTVAVDVRITEYLDSIRMFWTGFDYTTFDVEAVVINSRVKDDKGHESLDAIPATLGLTLKGMQFTASNRLTQTCYPEKLKNELKGYRDVLEQYIRTYGYGEVDVTDMFCSFVVGETDMGLMTIVVETETAFEQYNVFMSH